MTSVVDTSVKRFSSDMVGAPVLSGTAGAMVAVLDACMVNGFDVKSVTALVVASGVATLAFSAPHSAEVGSVVLVSGVTGALTALNGEQRVTAIASGVVKFATAAADGTAAGTISFKMAPLGWLKSFTGTNLAAYLPSDVMGTGMYLRVDDTGTTNARVVGYESMTDISTGVGPFPTSAQISGGGFWAKSYQANSTARQWFVVGDSRGVYVCTAPGSVGGNFSVHSFGDIASNKSGDAYGCALTAHAADRTALATAALECLGYSAKAAANTYIARAANSLGGAQAVNRVGSMHISNTDSYSGYGSYSPFSYPNDADNGLLFCKVLARVNAGLRGTFPGFYHVPQPVQDSFGSGDKVVATGGLSGRIMRALRVGAPAANTEGLYGVVFFDATGPWR